MSGPRISSVKSKTPCATTFMPVAPVPGSGTSVKEKVPEPLVGERRSTLTVSVPPLLESAVHSSWPLGAVHTALAGASSE